MLIRRATLADAEGIVEVGNAGWRWAYAEIIRPEDLATLEDTERTARIARSYEEGRIGFVAEIEGRVVGFAILQEPSSLPEADLEVGGLYVHPDFSRRGIGQAVLARALEEGIAWGRSKLAIHTLRDNYVGRAFYDRLGGSVLRPGEWGFRGVPYPTVWYLFEDLPGLMQKCLEARP